MSPLRLLYLAFAVWGAIHPMYWFLRHMRETGTGLSGLIDAWYVNASTTGPRLLDGPRRYMGVPRAVPKA